MITNNFTPYTGGVVSSIKALVHELQKSGHQVILVTLDFTSNHDDPSWVKRLYCPVRFMYKTNHMAIPWRAKAQLAKIIDQFKPNIIHLHHPFLLGPVANNLARRKAIPVVFTYHTLYESYAHYVPLLPEWLTQKAIKWQVLNFCKQVNGIIAPSGYVTHYVSQYTTTPTVTIPSGLLPQFIGASAIKQVIQHRAIKLLIVSRMVKEKNIHILLDVAKRLVDDDLHFEFNLIGYGSEYDCLKSYAYDTLRLSDNQIRFVHKPPKESIVKAYKEADLFLFSSTTDTQGIVLAEAMAQGTPVLALDGPGQRDIIKQGENGYIVQNGDEMVSRIKQLASDRDQLKQLSDGAYKSSQEYHPTIIVQRYLQFYNCLITNP